MMNSRLKSNRSTEAPMDFEFTSRSSANIKPAWATGDEPHTPKKRTLHDMNPPRPAFPPNTPLTPSFGTNTNVPFIFQSPIPQSQHPPPWVPPPPQPSPTKSFQPLEPEVQDVDMSEISPAPKLEPSEEDLSRAVSLGGMRRVFRSRHERAKSKGRARVEEDVSEDGESESDTDRRVTRSKSVGPQTMSNHYTLNMPSPAPPKSELPYVLSGYLQFFFNLCLILVFLYLLIQFILTVQRDVEQKISEYSMEIVQEISSCALMYKTNQCANNVIPHMVQPCGDWETCMNRDPTKVGRARIGAELIAEVINGFVEPISWKTLGFTLASLSFLTVFINTLFSFYRSKHQPAASAPVAIPPPAPYYHPIAGGPTWGWHPHGEDDSDMQTPARKRRLEGGVAAKIK